MAEIRDRRNGETVEVKGPSIEGVRYPSMTDLINGPEATRQLDEKYKGKPIRKAMTKATLKAIAAVHDLGKKKSKDK
ncbi:MAG: hypothetical protein EBR82_35005 [Caulobacteraceae bacterium]|nr:hypothetical protein [Caulobacteraceae bacterium]